MEPAEADKLDPFGLPFLFSDELSWAASFKSS